MVNKDKEYSWRVYEIHQGEELMVANGSSKNKEDAQRELNHYAMIYSQDEIIKIKKNWKEQEKQW